MDHNVLVPIEFLFFQHDAVDLGGAAQASLARRTGRLFINYLCKVGARRGSAEARDYMLALPNHRQSWQRAAELLLAQADVVLVSQQIQLALFPRLQTRPCGDDMKKKRRYRPRPLGDQIVTPRTV
jgi:hypothetical protein